MNRYGVLVLKGLRKVYQKTFEPNILSKPDCEQDPDVASKIIYDKLTDDEPRMIARFGANELTCLVNYIEERRNYLSFIQGKSQPWWFERGIVNQMHEVAGFFPPTEEKLEQFCELMLDDIPQVDVLGSWLAGERYFEEELRGVPKVWLDFLNPYFSKNPWTRVLKGKKILVVHPFTKTINKQFHKKRELLFDNKDILPDFELKTVQAVQTHGGNSDEFADWFEALDFMKDEINKHEYDICLIGAGAYGFPLAAHVKRSGKKAVHLGGALQLLFGIRGKRWEDPNLNEDYNFAELMNGYWVRPSEEETPDSAENVEGACYW